ncbi:ABC transporter permease [Rickettsiales endosymbiont of Paramecium tredecaurelia]|nr:ABC transporter permease [Candidatus Sarmatiella mevalonica]
MEKYHIQEGFNYKAFVSLCMREISRFCAVYHQTVIAPLVNAVLMLCIFAFALAPDSYQDQGYNLFSAPSVQFIACGLIMMSTIQNAFQNSSSSLIITKMNGCMYDILTPPFGACEFLFAMITGGVARGLMVSSLLVLCSMLFLNMHVAHVTWCIVYILLASCFAAQIGIFTGFFSNSFEQSSAITNYIISPLSLLSGTFYSMQKMPSVLVTINNYNPFYYLIDGFRCSTLCLEKDCSGGLLFVLALNCALFLLLRHLFNKGWRIKV